MKKSTKNQIKKEFFEFLRKNNCASKFCVNFYSKKERDRRYTWGIPSNTLAEYINKTIPETWIFFAFRWHKTIQNHDYWSKIHSKWEARAKVIEYNIQKSKDETNSH